MQRYIILYMVALILLLLALYAYLECPFQPYSPLMMAILGIIFTLIGYLKSQNKTKI